MPAISTAGTGETVGEDAALQVVAESLFHVSWGVSPCPSNWLQLANSSQVSKCSATERYSRFCSGCDGLDRAAAQLCLAQLWHTGVGAEALRSGQQG